MMGNTKASVFPDPVLDNAKTSFPRRKSGIARF